MWPFRRRQHRLPKFPPKIIPLFRGLCAHLGVDELDDLRREFDAAWSRKLSEMNGNIGFDSKTANELRQRCQILMDAYDQLPEAHRRLAIGAIRYCVATEDALSDEFFASGQRDDVKIMNHVLEEVGLIDAVIHLQE